MVDQPTILAIESAIRGGSIALSHGGDIIDIWQGEGGISRAEDLLYNIDLILKRNDIAKSSLKQMVVSVGPGSFTGIRIGLATAMGLATALNIDLARYSILHAMAGRGTEGGTISTAVPVGRGVICKQIFRIATTDIVAISEPTAIAADDFEEEECEVTTTKHFPRGLAVCLIDAVNDSRLPQTPEPLFIAKPSGI